MGDDITVGVLSLHNSKETKAILNAIEDFGYDGVWLRRQNTMIRIDDGELILSPEVDIVANRLLMSTGKNMTNLLGLSTTISECIPMLNRPQPTLQAVYKPAGYARMATFGVPVPDTTLSFTAPSINEIKRDVCDEWVIQKPAVGAHGEGTTRSRLDTPIPSRVGDSHIVLQEMIASDDEARSDIRVYVVDGQVLGGMKRVAPDDDWRTNVAQGGKPTKATISDELEDVALKATKAVGLDYAGVDIILEDNEPYVLEVNPTAGFRGFFEATGLSPAPYIARAAIETVGGDVDDEEVQSVAKELDDSVPEGRPEVEYPAQGQNTVGYIEEIRLTGGEKTTNVTAKADTGAGRTSIDASVAAEIGAGPIKDTVVVKSASFDSERRRPVVGVTVGIAHQEYTVNASVEDRSHMEQPVILGRDVLQHYSIELNSQHPDSEES